MNAPRSSAAHLALMLVAVHTWACGSSDRDSAAGAGGAAQTPACRDEECLRCIYEEPRLGNEHCDPEQQAFEIESFAILNAGCREACPSL